VLRKTRILFSEEIWNPLSICAVPAFVFDEADNPRLTPAELSVYAVACLDAENPRNNCQFRRSITALQKLTGFSYRKSVTEALQGLVAKNFIRPVGTRTPGSNEPQSYELVNPITREGLAIETSDKRNLQSLRSVLCHEGLAYFNLPTDVLRQMHTKTSAALALFVAADRCVNLAREREIEIRSAELRAMAGQDPRTFKRAVEEIHEKWLLIGFCDASSRTVLVTLIEPNTGKLLDSFEWEQSAVDKAERQKRYAHAVANRGQSNEQILAWAMWALRDDAPKRGVGTNFLFTCPACRNKKSHKKKLAVDPTKGTYGAFTCYDCRVGGSLNKLVAPLRGFLDSLTKLKGIEREEPVTFAKANAMLNGYSIERYNAA
jgi:hypothetical protein